MREFKQPFSLRDTGGAFAIETADGLLLAFVYYRPDPIARDVLKQLTREEARVFAERIVASLEPFPVMG